MNQKCKDHMYRQLWLIDQLIGWYHRVGYHILYVGYMLFLPLERK